MSALPRLNERGRLMSSGNYAQDYRMQGPRGQAERAPLDLHRRDGAGVEPVGFGRAPGPCDVAPCTESQCLPGAGGVSAGHLNSPLLPRPPAEKPLRCGCRPTLMIVPRGKALTVMPWR